MCLCFLVCRTRRQARACLRARGMCPLLLSNIIEQSTVLSKCAKMFRLNVETTNLFHHSRQKHIINGKPVYKGGERPKTKQITPPSVTGALIVLLQWHYISLLHCSSCEEKQSVDWNYWCIDTVEKQLVKKVSLRLLYDTIVQVLMSYKVKLL